MLAKISSIQRADSHEFLDSEQLYGNIFEFLDKGMLFVNRHLPLAAKIVPGKLSELKHL